MKKILLSIFAICCLCMMEGQAQDYSRSFGIRAGLGANVTYKQFISNASAFEGMAGFYFGNLYAALVYEKHNNFANDIAGLTWYWGAGGSILLKSGELGIGIAGAIGLDYSFRDIPLNVSLDWMPNVFITGTNGVEAGGGGVSLRYILDR